jgi:L-fucose isomerase-like protein
VQTVEDAEKLAPALQEADGILILHLSLGTMPILQKLVDLDRPTLVFSQPFSGHEWMFVQQWARAGKPVILQATRELGELARGVAILKVPGMLRQSRLIVIGAPDGTPPARSPEKIKEKLGVDVVSISVPQLVEAHRAVDPKAAEADAAEWIGRAKAVIEPSREEIVKSSRMFLAMRGLMKAERAQAITVRCLGGIPIDVLGYPCLGFVRLLDAGFIGACEADMDSTLTMLMYQYAFGVPGFITDPLFDTSRNAVIHAHCTAPTRMDGCKGAQAPYSIRNHRDDNKGAALEVEMRLGQTITCSKLVNLDTMLVSTGKIIEVPDFDDRGCRTQITTEVASAQQMLDNWGAGLLEGWVAQLHRVVFYGDHMQSTRDLAGLLGLKVIEAM